jgi:ADP-ribosylglycohydrolase
MPGGGYHSVAPGQVTDDSEMMMSLMWAYIESNEAVEGQEDEKKIRKLDLEKVGDRYARWYSSDPFDIG